MTQTTYDRPMQKRLADNPPDELGLDSLAGEVERHRVAHSKPSQSAAVPQKRIVKVVPWRETEIDRWVWAAMQNVVVEKREDGGYNVEVPGATGAWYAAPTVDGALIGLPDVLFDWAEIKVEDGDDDIPVFDGINLNPR